MYYDLVHGISEVAMWEQLFLFCLLLFDVKAKEAYLESGSQEDVCENGNGKILPVILNTEDNAVGFHQIGSRYTGSDARQGLSVMPSSRFGDFVSAKLRKVTRSLSQVNPKAVLLRMATSLEMVMNQTVLGLDLLRNGLVADFSKAVNWVNQWWQVLNSVFKSWLPSTNRQGRTSASHFLELSAFIRTFHWLRGEKREKVRRLRWKKKVHIFPGCAWKSFFSVWIWLERGPDHASTSYNGGSTCQR